MTTKTPDSRKTPAAKPVKRPRKTKATPSGTGPPGQAEDAALPEATDRPTGYGTSAASAEGLDLIRELAAPGAFGPGMGLPLPDRPGPTGRGFGDPESRGQLATLITRLFDLWRLPTADQLELLGLSPASRSLLVKYRKGEPLPASRDVQDRVGWLLSIHKSLRTLYPENPALCYGWVHRPHRWLANFAPLAVMKTQGLVGIVRVAQLLNHLKGF